jgi:hypothetical protein
MSKSRVRSSRPKTRWNLIIILVVACILSYAGYKYFTRQKPQPLNIMVIAPSELTFGDTTISGGLHKDANGDFVLVLPDRRTIKLDVNGVDSLDGSPVTVSGYLVPPTEANPSLFMVVKSISIASDKL